MMHNDKTQTLCISPNITYILAWIAFLLSLLVVYINFSTGDLPRNILYSSDALYLPSLYKDVFSGIDISGWKLTPAPYFFPDMLLYFLLNALTGNFHLAIVFFGVIQSIVFVFSLLCLSNQLFGFDKNIHSLLLLAGTVFFLGFSMGNYGEFWYIFVSAHHFSLVPSIIFSIVLALQVIDEDSRNKLIIQLLFLAVLAVLMTISDMLYIVQFAIPLVITLAFLTWLSIIAIKRVFFLNGVLISSVLLGIVLNKTLIRHENISLYTQITLNSIEKEVKSFVTWFSNFFVAHPILSFLELGFILATVVILVKLFKDLSSRNNKKKVFVIVIFFLFAFFISVTAIVISNNIVGGMERYFLAFLIIPIFFGWVFVMGAYVRLVTKFSEPIFFLQKHYDRLILGFILSTIIFSVISVKDISALSDLSDYSTPFIKCITENTEKNDIKNGIAQYLQAKYISMLSKNNLNIVQTYPNLSPFHWTNNLNWYNTDFEFVIIDNNIPPLYKIDKPKIIQRFGNPASIFKCENSEILVYNRSGDVLFQKQFQGNIAFASFDKPNDTFEFYGANLPSLVGKPLGFSMGADENWNSTPGYLTYGPYAILPKGEYYFEIHYFAEGGNIPIGSWDVVIGEDDDLLSINTGDITKTGKNVISGTFKIPKKQRTQIRTFYNGAGALFVDKIVLERLSSHSKNESVSIEQDTLMDTPVLQLAYPKNNTLVHQETIDFVWEWTGKLLTEKQAFEIRVWQVNDTVHYGAHNALASVKDIRQIGDTYILRLSSDGFYSTKLHGTGDYLWSVAIVEIMPTYQDLHLESPPHSLRIERKKN